MRVTSTLNPLPQGDDWALLPDGTVALVRGRDYHVDWLAPDGTMTASPKIPFQWERLSDEQKVAFIDSARVAIEEMRATGRRGPGAFGPLLATRGDGGAGGARGRRAGADTARRDSSRATPGNSSPTGAGETGTMTVTAGTNTTVTAIGPGGGGQLPQINLVAPSELPDYKPAFTPGSTDVDADGNLWIRTSQNVDARPVYNVVNRKGELVDRVQLPANRVLVGFGPGGIAYLAVRDGNVAHLERARIK